MSLPLTCLYKVLSLQSQAPMINSSGQAKGKKPAKDNSGASWLTHLPLPAGGERAAAVCICVGFRSFHTAAGPVLPAGLPKVSLSVSS